MRASMFILPGVARRPSGRKLLVGRRSRNLPVEGGPRHKRRHHHCRQRRQRRFPLRKDLGRHCRRINDAEYSHRKNVQKKPEGTAERRHPDHPGSFQIHVRRLHQIGGIMKVGEDALGRFLIVSGRNLVSAEEFAAWERQAPRTDRDGIKLPADIR